MRERGGAASRHDYARCWRGLKPADRDKRLTEALRRLADGETLAQVAATWSISASALCRALIAYAPQEWRRALTARAVVRYQAAMDLHATEPGNPMARARAWAARWHLEHALRVLAESTVRPLGWEFVGRCPKCEGRVYVRRNGSASCYLCGWEGGGGAYLLAEIAAARGAESAS